MPVVGIPLDELFSLYGEEIPPKTLEHELHRFGCSVEGWATLRRYRCPRCASISETAEETAPPACDGCGVDFRTEGNAPEEAGSVRVLRMELLAVRPDLFDPPGLARALRGFLGKDSGAPAYRLEEGPWSVEVDPALGGPEVVRPRIVMAIVRNLGFSEASLRSLMKLQENIHWALGRDRKLASIGVYDLETVASGPFRYRAIPRVENPFVPLGYDPSAPDSSLTPERILEEHPKGRAFARLLEGCARVPLLTDAEGRVLSMPPIINSERTRVTLETKDVVIDVTGLSDRQIDRALNIVVTSLLESCPTAWAETVEVRYGDETRRTPDLAPQAVAVGAADAGRLIGVELDAPRVAELLGRMRHDTAMRDGDGVDVEVPAWRADIVHPRDLVEDIAIAYGYDRLPRIDLAAATFAEPHPVETMVDRARRALVGLGAMEVMTLTLTSEDVTFGKCGIVAAGEPVELEHPISVEQTMLRVSLIPGLMETLAVNLGHVYPQRVFEVGSVAFYDEAAETGAREARYAALALAGDGLGYADIRSIADAFLADWGRSVGDDLGIVPADDALFLPGRGAALDIDGRRIGVLGEVHPRVLEAFRVIHPVAIFEVDLDELARGRAAD